ncbi:MAG: hypothetical protein Q9201_007959 [Fulgogasparrea decipioides]
MAEAAAIVGLVASIASLVDLSAKVVSRLREFTSKSSDIPESFRSLSTLLPLLTATLQHIQSQAEAGRLPEDVTKALTAVVDNAFEQVSTVQISLAKVLPSGGASKLERALKALKSLAKEDKLSPKSQPDRQRIVSIVGMGGMGKTQLSLAHIRDHADDYSSVFWLNAKDEPNLRQSMANLSVIVFPQSANPAAPSGDDEKLQIDKVRRWLSEAGNDQWLLIFDNYDNPRLPGIDSSTGYDIRTYFPHRARGSILITTRSPRLLFAKQLPLKKLEDVEQSLAILAVRSGRKVDGDVSATRLALRLDGLPLALATAGAYLSQSADSFDDYLELYNNSWSDLSQYSHGPADYEERTLYSTWNVSFQQVRGQDPEAAELLKLLAYLDNQDLWYGLFPENLNDAPAWWTEVMKSRVRFNRAISTLHSYSLLEVNAGQYRLHACEHDWTLEHPNHEFDQEGCRIAIHCVAANVIWKSEAEYWVRNRRVLPHARRFQHFRINAAVDWSGIESGELSWFAYLYKQNDMNAEAEEMYMRALRGYEKAWGLEHTSTLDTVNNLGNLYKAQGKMAEAEEMYMRALRGYKKAWGLEHTSTLNTVNNLGLLYADQGKMAEAEEMYMRALRGYEKAVGKDHPRTLTISSNLEAL